jgi:Fe2+ or Zn2+ uptake regulation protein
MNIMERTGIESALRVAGFRATEGRIRLLAELSAAREPLSVRDITRALRKNLDEANVYRALKALARRGLVRMIQIERERARFEIARDHHHHIVCTACGRIEDVHVEADAVLECQALSRSSFARVESHALEFFGVCSPCGRKC